MVYAKLCRQCLGGKARTGSVGIFIRADSYLHRTWLFCHPWTSQTKVLSSLAPSLTEPWSSRINSWTVTINVSQTSPAECWETNLTSLTSLFHPALELLWVKGREIYSVCHDLCIITDFYWISNWLSTPLKQIQCALGISMQVYTSTWHAPPSSSSAQ